MIPSVVLAESTTGTRRDACIDAVLKYASVHDLDATIARRAGSLRHSLREKAPGIVDAIVVATADHLQGSTILTDDRDDIRLLADEMMRSAVVSLSELR